MEEKITFLLSTALDSKILAEYSELNLIKSTQATVYMQKKYNSTRLKDQQTNGQGYKVT